MGQSGTTGNASDENLEPDETPVTPHVHFKSSVEVDGIWYSKNPEELLPSTYNSAGTMTSSPCII